VELNKLRLARQEWGKQLLDNYSELQNVNSSMKRIQDLDNELKSKTSEANGI